MEIRPEGAEIHAEGQAHGQRQTDRRRDKQT